MERGIEVKGLPQPPDRRAGFVPRKPKLAARPKSYRAGYRKAKASWLLAMARRFARKILRGQRSPKDLRNHGFKGVKKRGRTGLSGR